MAICLPPLGTAETHPRDEGARVSDAPCHLSEVLGSHLEQDDPPEWPRGQLAHFPPSTRWSQTDNEVGTVSDVASDP